MTHLLDSSALLAHFLNEPGAALVQSIFDNQAFSPGISILSLYEFDLRLHLGGLDEQTRFAALKKLRTLVRQVAPVDEVIRGEAIRMRIQARSRISTVDILIAATARVHRAIFVHRDAHFERLLPGELKTLVLPQK